MTALSTKNNQLKKLAQPTERYLNNYYEYRNILIAEFTKVFLHIMLAHVCGSKNKIRNYSYHQIQVVGYQSPSPVQYPVKSTSDRISLITPSIVFTTTLPLKVQQSLIFLYFFSCLVFLANAARRRVRSSLSYTVGPSPLSRKRRLARVTTSRTWAVANLTITGRGLFARLHLACAVRANYLSLCRRSQWEV